MRGKEQLLVHGLRLEDLNELPDVGQLKVYLLCLCHELLWAYFVSKLDGLVEVDINEGCRCCVSHLLL